jgi:aspartyl/asparaginyl beta-hydroxylase (cupin superfamily)
VSVSESLRRVSQSLEPLSARDIAQLLVSAPPMLIAAKMVEIPLLLTRQGRVRLFPNRTFAWEAPLEERWQVMREELDAVLQHDGDIPRFRQIHPAVTPAECWKAYLLWGHGRPVQRNCRECPETAKILAEVPGLTTAMFSILPPRSHLPRHRGYYKGLLRYHLGLRIPAVPGACRFEVGDHRVAWEEGKGFAFDNAYAHEAWNDSDEVRVILFLDVIREVPPGFAGLNRWVIHQMAKTPFVRDAETNLARWYAQVDDGRHE